MNMVAPDQDRFAQDCAAFVDDRIAPFADSWDQKEALDPDIVPGLSRAGFLDLPFRDPSDAASLTKVGVLHEEVGRGCGSVRSLLTVQGMVGRCLRRWAHPGLSADWLPRLSNGEAIAGFAMTEAGAGSELERVQARVTREKDRLILNGEKKWVSFGEIAGCFLVLAQSGEGPCVVFVPGDATGVIRTPVRGLLGLRASHLADLTFQDVELDASSLLGRPGAGLAFVVSYALDFGRFSVACGCVGLARACLEESVAHLAPATSTNPELVKHQLVRRRLTRMLLGVETAKLLCRKAGEASDLADPNSVSLTALAKLHAAETAMQVAASAVQVQGAQGCSGQRAANRHFRDAKIMEIIEGTTEMHEAALADLALRLHGSLPKGKT
ncbi:acyl-CoA dehydrogenase family protein [Roseibium sp. Sym1]|uniref:acyl-CoA dehydrogenase family protein n=1 Tax=Roseibium sp. Sym1 TaxID=3016006 RepID=UPI0022B3EB20|nr:acyl-CoA dehydrogenase [Roseibium sp. Sym1]